jgi:hypothetical protein
MSKKANVGRVDFLFFYAYDGSALKFQEGP